MIVFYEVTRACDLVCLHCRASAQSRPDPNELTSELSRQLIDQVARFPVRPMLVLTGGDPLKRGDIYDLIAYSRGQGLETAITPSPTPLVTTEAIARLQKAGIDRMAVSIDGADAATHDRMRGVPGSFAQTQRIMKDARNLGIAVQVNTTLNPDNFDQIEAMADMLARHQIVLWSVFFIVPVGRATAESAAYRRAVRRSLRAALCPVAVPALRHQDDRGDALPPVRGPAARCRRGRPRARTVRQPAPGT